LPYPLWYRGIYGEDARIGEAEEGSDDRVRQLLVELKDAEKQVDELFVRVFTSAKVPPEG
jgi:hypothetical protein